MELIMNQPFATTIDTMLSRAIALRLQFLFGIYLCLRLSIAPNAPADTIEHGSCLPEHVSVNSPKVPLPRPNYTRYGRQQERLNAATHIQIAITAGHRVARSTTD
jgi:hypothetical protein